MPTIQHVIFRIVHQPACSSVVTVENGSLHADRRGKASVSFQGSREACAGYMTAIRHAGHARLCPVICPPGDCTRLDWVDRDPPTTWHADCREWRAAL
jgi:hypothetical protein